MQSLSYPPGRDGSVFNINFDGIIISHQVPILEHGDAKVIESSICAEYVAEALADQVR